MGGGGFVEAGADARDSRAAMKWLQQAQHAPNETVACKACHGGSLGAAAAGARALARQNPPAVPAVRAARRRWCSPV